MPKRPLDCHCGSGYVAGTLRNADGTWHCGTCYQQCIMRGETVSAPATK